MKDKVTNRARFIRWLLFILLVVLFVLAFAVHIGFYVAFLVGVLFYEFVAHELEQLEAFIHIIGKSDKAVYSNLNWFKKFMLNHLFKFVKIDRSK